MRSTVAVLFAVFSATIAQRPAFGLTNSVVNVTDTGYCTTVNGSFDNTSCIQSAVNTVQAAGGGTVYFPCGNYKTTSQITISASGVNLRGEGLCTAWRGYGSFNTLTYSGTSSSQIYNDSIDSLYFDEVNKTGGVTLYGYQVGRFKMDNVLIDRPACGPYFEDFNDIVIRRLRVQRLTQDGCQLLILRSSNTGRSDTADLYDVILQGSNTGVANNGLVIDGFVNTVSSHKLYMVNIGGHGLWVRNSGASHAPQFITMYGLEADFPSQTAVWLNAGSTFHFSDTQVHGSLNNHNIYISPEVSRVSFEGGFSTGAHNSGMDIFGSVVRVTGMEISDNSAPPQGGTAGFWSGLVIEDQARSVTITGNKVGSPSNPSYQKYGIQINGGADQYAIVGNSVSSNASGGISGASGTSSKVIASNQQ